MTPSRSRPAATRWSLLHTITSNAAAISSDRSDVPAGGQVYITVSDFQLNLDPTAADEWTLNNDEDKTSAYESDSYYYT